ncbi:hypothetical protein FWK35_00023534 [Aphis craccivora]|uniref:Uncharacterized protein n=1 Tax=Aphis craccivora TaxID=307492 RepID=A0A6G0Y8I4_APHCR|nr:hypothetical protein FWK35_00023534 [Aphis craccivora]
MFFWPSNILHSERNDECIDFTMMCVFFIFFFCVCHHVLEHVRKNPKKVTEKREFLRKTSF